MNSLKVVKLKAPFDRFISNIASDKSISHRCAILSLFSDKPSVIYDYLQAQDTQDSLNIAEQLGAKVDRKNNKTTITPPNTITTPTDPLECGNAGTAIRLWAGFLSGCDGEFVLTGDKYLLRRPMGRVVKPLCSIGADITDHRGFAPLTIIGNNNLKSFDFHSDIDSAQVKSAMILACLKGGQNSTYTENNLTRDHTERMLVGMGADITYIDNQIDIKPTNKPYRPLNLTVPSDPSSAFFFAVAAAITPNSKVVLKNVSLNPTRIEAYRCLEQMGADITYNLKEDIYEPIGDIVVRHSKLNGITIDKNIPWLIDELPALSIAMGIAKGKSIVKNAKELRVKESDRISSVIENLKLCGIKCHELEDGYSIDGGGIFQQATVNSHGDHRVAMSFAIAGLLCGMEIEDTDCIETSFPNFQEILVELSCR